MKYGHLAVVHVPAGHRQRPLPQGLGLVRAQEVDVDDVLEAQTGAFRTGPKGTVEAEQPGFDLLDAGAAVRAGVLVAHQQRVLSVVDDDQPLGQLQRVFHAVGQPLFDALLDDQAVDDHADAVADVLVQLDLFLQGADLAVHLDPEVARLFQGLEHLFKGALFAPHHGGFHQNAGLLGQGHDAVDDGVDALFLDEGAAVGAVDRPHPGKQQPEVVVDLGDRSHRGAGIVGSGLLIDGNGRRKSFDKVYVRLVHLPQELPGIGRKALHVAPLSLGKDGVKGQGGLARTAQPRQHHQLVAGNVYVDVFQIVLSRALDKNLVSHGIAVFQRFSLDIWDIFIDI